MHFAELQEVLQHPSLNIRERYTELYRILQTLLTEGTADCKTDFSGPFARLTWLANHLELDTKKRQRLNEVRVRCREVMTCPEEELLAALPYDVRIAAQLDAILHHEAIPESLASLFPSGEARPHTSSMHHDCLRVCVLSWDDTFIHALDEAQEPLTLCYTDPENNLGDWSYLSKLLRQGTRLNLVRPTWKEQMVYAELIIFEPDYLVDISTIASCFETYGTTPYALLIHRLSDTGSTLPILLGNLAGRLLDEVVNKHGKTPTPYPNLARDFMRQNAFSLLACAQDISSLHHEAEQQLQNLTELLDTACREDRNFEISHTLLEPSFFCELLGLQGRMDLLQDDFSVLMEQKSGKRDFRTGKHVEKHYVQMLLYQALIHYSFHLRNDEISSYLLYSKYADGLIKEGSAPRLLHQAFFIRNQLTWLEFELSKGASQMLNILTPERMADASCTHNNLWLRYTRPALAGILDPLQQASPVARAYFHRMTTFIAREHLLCKIGTPGREGSGMAALWNSNLDEKRTAGNIFTSLHILPLEEEEYQELSFLIPEEENDTLPNFRVGDAVVAYSYDIRKEPDVRSGVVFRGSIRSMHSDRITIHLRNPQHNQFVFLPQENRRWAIEHDTIESSFAVLYRSIFSLLTTLPSRRELLLAQRKPERDITRLLLGEYHNFNPLVMNALQAKDYFILIGPPGTGKTSFGLMNIVQEHLLHDCRLLLLSYTNRAVDEMCSKLVDAHLDFLRIGSSFTCQDSYKPFLMEERVKACNTLSEISDIVRSARVVVGTTSTLSAHPEIFDILSFDVAVIDEASQILEPHLLGILCARHGKNPAVGKFILIGDHKQLPAVVQQEPSESSVREKLLHDIGLEDCRESLFQRLLRLQQQDYPQCDSPFVYRFTHQGRMHPEVADFARLTFYEGMLDPVPLPHQCGPLTFPLVEEDNQLQHLLATHRVLFFPVEKPLHSTSPKMNPEEAKCIAQVVFQLYQLYHLNHREFTPLHTVGIIVPYRHQIALIRRELASYGITDFQDITIDTVERYQGSQRDVILYGFTIQFPYQMDFLCSQSFEENGQRIDRKLNVALTRAKEQLILVGNPTLLQSDPVHHHLLEYLHQNCSR